MSRPVDVAEVERDARAVLRALLAPPLLDALEEQSGLARETLTDGPVGRSRTYAEAFQALVAEALATPRRPARDLDELYNSPAYYAREELRLMWRDAEQMHDGPLRSAAEAAVSALSGVIQAKRNHVEMGLGWDRDAERRVEEARVAFVDLLRRLDVPDPTGVAAATLADARAREDAR